jgi:hypothetical protein
MIKKSSLKRVAHYAGAFLLAGAAVGCGDDGGNDVDAGGGADAGPDAACVGHACGGTNTPFELAEGGEFRLERLQQNADNSMQYLASQAFFFKGQTPAARPLGLPELELVTDPALKALGYSCQDFRVGNLFDNGFTAAAQAIVDTRDYYSVGDEVTLTNVADEQDVITLSKRTDPAEAIDLSAGLTHKILYRGPDAQDVELNTIYRPAIPGSLEYPSLDLKYGQSVAGEEMADPTTGVGTPQLYMPSAFTMTAPTEVEFYTEGFLSFTKGDDYEMTYDFEPAPEGWPTILPFIGFLNSSFQVVAFCAKGPTPAEPKPDNGEFIVPAEVLEILGDITPGPVIMGRFTHVAWEYQQDKSRLDLLGIECKLSPVSGWQVEDAPVN